MQNSENIMADVSPEAKDPQQSLTVSQLSYLLKQTIEETFGFVKVRGEISGAKQHSSGHLYFRLKDTDAVIDAVAWRGSLSRLNFRPEDGMEVLCSGRLTTYPGASRYQIVVDHLELAGQGALLQLLEERKRKLAAEGLFDPSKKRALPFFPEVIGIITSPTGAVIQDILHRISDRFPCHVILWPVAVQGQGAAEQIAAAVRGFQNLQPKPDLLILARGGGSLEDLWAFNEECVVRAVCASSIPTISAVGHETDVTLCDFAADKRAPTPTAAAEIATPLRLQLATQLLQLQERSQRFFTRLFKDSQEKTTLTWGRFLLVKRLVDDLSLRLEDRFHRLHISQNRYLEKNTSLIHLLSAKILHPKQQVDQLFQKVEALGRSLLTSKKNQLAEKRHSLSLTSAMLETLSYKKVLERGYVHVTAPQGKTISLGETCLKTPTVFLNFHDKTIQAKPLPAPQERKKTTNQGELF